MSKPRDVSVSVVNTSNGVLAWNVSFALPFKLRKDDSTGEVCKTHRRELQARIAAAIASLNIEV